MTVSGREDTADGDWATDKAEFVRRGDRLRKRYVAHGEAAQDALLLRTIAEHYRPRRCDGWIYRAIHVHGVDGASNELTMEYIPGTDGQDLFERTRDPESFRHAGRWLGFLHDSSPAGPASVTTFNDFNCSNVVIDASERQVVALDPGRFIHASTRPGVSLAVGALSAGRISMRADPRAVPTCLRSYLLGYLEATQGKRLPPLRIGWSYVLKRIRSERTRAFISRGPVALRLAAGIVEVSGWAALTALLGRLTVRDLRRGQRHHP